MNLLGRKKSSPTDDAASEAVELTESDAGQATAGKGRPTPKRRDAEKRRGPIAPAPQTGAEARKRRKELRGPKLSRDERRIASTERRARMADSREKMMSGEEAYLLPRDKGPVRALARDLVDSRRNILGLFMPFAMTLIFVMFAVPQLQLWMTPAMLVLMAVMTVDGIFIARLVNNRVAERFPESDDGGWKLGWYAASRASQLRKMRAPRPRVNRGEPV